MRVMMKMDLEARMQRLRDDLVIERDERATLIQRLSDLKNKVYELEKKGSSIPGMLTRANIQTKSKARRAGQLSKD